MQIKNEIPVGYKCQLQGSAEYNVTSCTPKTQTLYRRSISNDGLVCYFISVTRYFGQQFDEKFFKIQMQNVKEIPEDAAVWNISLPMNTLLTEVNSIEDTEIIEFDEFHFNICQDLSNCLRQQVIDFYLKKLIDKGDIQKVKNYIKSLYTGTQDSNDIMFNVLCSPVIIKAYGKILDKITFDDLINSLSDAELYTLLQFLKDINALYAHLDLNITYAFPTVCQLPNFRLDKTEEININTGEWSLGELQNHVAGFRNIPYFELLFFYLDITMSLNSTEIDKLIIPPKRTSPSIFETAIKSLVRRKNPQDNNTPFQMINSPPPIQEKEIKRLIRLKFGRPPTIETIEGDDYSDLPDLVESGSDSDSYPMLEDDQKLPTLPPSLTIQPNFSPFTPLNNLPKLSETAPIVNSGGEPPIDDPKDSQTDDATSENLSDEPTEEESIVQGNIPSNDEKEALIQRNDEPITLPESYFDAFYVATTTKGKDGKQTEQLLHASYRDLVQRGAVSDAICLSLLGVLQRHSEMLRDTNDKVLTQSESNSLRILDKDQNQMTAVQVKNLRVNLAKYLRSKGMGLTETNRIIRTSPAAGYNEPVQLRLHSSSSPPPGNNTDKQLTALRDRIEKDNKQLTKINEKINKYKMKVEHLAERLKSENKNKHQYKVELVEAKKHEAKLTKHYLSTKQLVEQSVKNYNQLINKANERLTGLSNIWVKRVAQDDKMIKTLQNMITTMRKQFKAEKKKHATQLKLVRNALQESRNINKDLKASQNHQEFSPNISVTSIPTQPNDALVVYSPPPKYTREQLEIFFCWEKFIIAYGQLQVLRATHPDDHEQIERLTNRVNTLQDTIMEYIESNSHGV